MVTLFWLIENPLAFTIWFTGNIYNIAMIFLPIALFLICCVYGIPVILLQRMLEHQKAEVLKEIRSILRPLQVNILNQVQLHGENFDINPEVVEKIRILLLLEERISSTKTNLVDLKAILQFAITVASGLGGQILYYMLPPA